MDEKTWKVPSRSQAAWFWLRSRLLVARRHGRNFFDKSYRRWSASGELADAPVQTQTRSSLWDDNRADEFALLAGKIHNLRVASRSFDAVVVPAGECLSFWRQLGRPSASRGYVLGREIREGCVIPTIAGGICQLSNALATCAKRAGFELVECHAHSASVEGVLEQGSRTDATVFWNYVDLKIRAPMPWRLEVQLTDSELVLTIRAHRSEVEKIGTLAIDGMPSKDEVARTRPAPVAARGCLSCNEGACFRHRPEMRRTRGATVWLLEGATPEFASYLASCEPPERRIQPLPIRTLGRWLTRRSISDPWSTLAPPVSSPISYAVTANLRRTWLLRRSARSQGQRQEAIVKGARLLARACAQRLRPEDTRLVIDQAWLPHLHQLGVLAGRSYDVLAPALPMQEIQERLNFAVHRGVADSRTLLDFRVDDWLLCAEIDAMRHARRVITAHAEVAEHWKAHGRPDVVQLSWILPSPSAYRKSPGKDVPVLVFPASALARKGAYELAAALRGLRCRLLILGSRSDDLRLWQGVEVEYVGWRLEAWVPQADLVILPAYVEHAPRATLHALAAGVPVIATPACGLQGLAGVTIVPPGDVLLLQRAVITLLNRAMG